MHETIWSNMAPPGRTYHSHLRAQELAEDDPTRNGPPTFRQVVTQLGGGPIRTHSSLAVLFDTCEMGFSIDDSMEVDTAVINGQRLRVTGLYA